MQDYVVRLQSQISTSYRCHRAADSLDIDTAKKSIHELKISGNLTEKYNIGLIVGASGSGKSTLAQHVWGSNCFDGIIKQDTPILEQFPEEMSYDQCAQALGGMGLTSVPCWIRPVYTLSTGQKARAEAALRVASTKPDETIVIDEWTSTVDRNIAKVMSHCIQKHARRNNCRIVVVTCHYDVGDWLNPDWVVDCNKQEYIDRRSMVGAYERSDRLWFDVREVDRKTWRYFSHYHYLSNCLPGGKIFTFGLFNGPNQIGFQCFAAYIIGNHTTFFSNRTVIHPDYAGFGLGILLINESSKLMVRRGYTVKAKFSSVPVYKSMSKQKEWHLTKVAQDIVKARLGKIKNMTASSVITREKSFRSKTTTYHFNFVWKPSSNETRVA